jgi:hypothetical protein
MKGRDMLFHAATSGRGGAFLLLKVDSRWENPVPGIVEVPRS